MSHKMFNHSRGGGYKANIRQPPRRGQPPKRGQKCRSQSVLSSEVLLYFDTQLIPTFSQQELSIPITTKEQSSLTLSDSNIQLNELYDMTLTVDGTTSTYLRRLSKCTYTQLYNIKEILTPISSFFPVSSSCCRYMYRLTHGF